MRTERRQLAAAQIPSQATLRKWRAGRIVETARTSLLGFLLRFDALLLVAEFGLSAPCNLFGISTPTPNARAYGNTRAGGNTSVSSPVYGKPTAERPRCRPGQV